MIHVFSTLLFSFFIDTYDWYRKLENVFTPDTVGCHKRKKERYSTYI